MDTEQKVANWRSAARKLNYWARGGVAPLKDDAPAAQRHLANLARPASAQSIVEFMLISVPLLALIFGIMEFGLVFFKTTNLDFTTRELARTVQICSNECDVTIAADGSIVNGYAAGGTFYRDYYMLRELNKQINNASAADVEYVMLQHVGEYNDNPLINPETRQPYGGGRGLPVTGRAGPDTYANYQFHYQLYALPKNGFPASNLRSNNVAPRANDVKNIRYNDARPGEIRLLSANGVLGTPVIPFNADNNRYNGWRANRCLTNETDATCRKNIPNANADGTAAGGTPVPTWRGRYVCVPTDRFYVQVVIRHDWITPFLPTISTRPSSVTTLIRQSI
jgi:TadE-like protein